MPLLFLSKSQPLALGCDLVSNTTLESLASMCFDVPKQNNPNAFPIRNAFGLFALLHEISGDKFSKPSAAGSNVDNPGKTDALDIKTNLYLL